MNIPQACRFPALTVACSLLLFSGCSLPQMIIVKDPLSPEEHINLGVAYERQGELDHALKEYRLAAKKLPQAYLYLGNVYFQKKDWEKAEESYKTAIEQNPQEADAYNNLAWLYFTRRENLDQGENLALKAIELNPEKEPIYRDTLDKIREIKPKGVQ